MRTKRTRGQAAVEFAIGVFIFALILSVMTGFARVFLAGLEMQSEVRCDAGLAALSADDGSESQGGATAITARAHPDADAVHGEDPWAYPIEKLPAERRFTDWRGDGVTTVRTIPASQKKKFRFRMTLGGDTLLDDDGHLSEDIHLPALRVGR